MRLFTYEKSGRMLIGAEKDGRLYEISGYSDMKDLIKRFDSFDENGDLEKEGTVISDVKICCPLEPEGDVICLGVNYGEHKREASAGIGFEKEAAAVYFSKRVAVLTGHGDMIPHYDMVDDPDYEAELGVVIGRDAKNVSADDAYNYVFGYTVVNDVSARTLQKRHKQFYRGKSLDGYTPMGPCIVTADEIEDPHNLKIMCEVNGQIRQDSSTSNMITSIPEIIAELSAGTTLKAGTVISTGTPAGTGMGMNPPSFLKSGDEVVCTVEGIGSLKNICE